MYDNFLADKITSCNFVKLPYWTHCQINGCERHAEWKMGYDLTTSYMQWPMCALICDEHHSNAHCQSHSAEQSDVLA